MKTIRLTSAVVIGGCGFLGRHLVEELIRRKTYTMIRVIDLLLPDRRPIFEEEDLIMFSYHCVDLRDEEALIELFQNMDVVFHCASPPPSHPDRHMFIEVNVWGTEKVIRACRQSQVRRLVLTSTCSVVYEAQDIFYANETFPYATSPIDDYVKSKIEQEIRVLEANDSRELWTAAIRPHGIFGPGDPQLVPSVVQAAQKGKLKFVIGKGDNLVDFTHVRNVAYAHILAAERLYFGSRVCGQAYIITNDAPIHFWAFINSILLLLGFKLPKYSLPYNLVYWIACLMQWFHMLVGRRGGNNTLTPLKVALAGTHHYYDCSKAKKDLGYVPLVSLKTGLIETIQDYQQTHLSSADKSLKVS
jgi:sterol-4alpha-carboxylate 3-dehydrogenase (decarboxylating)